MHHSNGADTVVRWSYMSPTHAHRLNTHYPTRRADFPVTWDALVLAQRMLLSDFSQRPTAQQCLNSSYIGGASTAFVAVDKENLGTGMQKGTPAGAALATVANRVALAPVVK